MLEEPRLTVELRNCAVRYGFLPRMSTTDGLFALKMLIKKYREGQMELHYVWIEELWYFMRKSGVAEKYVRVVYDMHESYKTVLWV